MKLSPRRYNVEEFPSEQSWIGPLLSTLNTTNQELFNGLNNSITIEDNLKQEIKELKFVNDSSNFPLSFKTKFQQSPKGMHPIFCLATDGTTASNTPWLTWTYANGLITVTNITNLTSSKSYTLRLHLIYE